MKHVCSVYLREYINDVRITFVGSNIFNNFDIRKNNCYQLLKEVLQEYNYNLKPINKQIKMFDVTLLLLVTFLF